MLTLRTGARAQEKVPSAAGQGLGLFKLRKDKNLINTIAKSPGEILPALKVFYDLRLPVFLWGGPGIGKSDLVHEFAREQRMELIDQRLTTLDSVDLRGLPWIDTQKGLTRWYRPEFLPAENCPGIILLDELTAAEPRLQAASYELVLDRRVGPHELPSDWWVVGAGNRPEDGAICYAMGTALADRFCHILVEANAKDWIDWGLQHEIHPSVITFIKIHPDYLNSNQGQEETDQLIRPSPRSWERVSHLVKKTTDPKVRSIGVAGLVGEAAAIQYQACCEELEGLPPIEDLLLMKVPAAVRRVPKRLSALYGLAYSLVSYANEPETFRAAGALLDGLAKVRDELPRQEIRSFAMELLLGKATKLGFLEELAATPELARYLEAYEEAENEAVK